MVAEQEAGESQESGSVTGRWFPAKQDPFTNAGIWFGVIFPIPTSIVKADLVEHKA